MFHVEQFFDFLNPVESKLKKYQEILLKWQKNFNLISKNTEKDIWTRHILDSAQLWKYIPDSVNCLLDIGSGAGFPAVVLAVLNTNTPKIKRIVMVEKDVQKAVFLKEVIRELSLTAEVLDCKIQEVQLEDVDVVTARAFSSLKELIELMKPFYHKGTIGLFLKGESVDKEINELNVPVSLDKIQSLTHNKSQLVYVKEIFYP